MSSILKALKKLEHEKTVRKPDSFRIDAEILRGGGQRKPLVSGAFLAAVLLFLCGVGGTYLFMSHEMMKTSAPQYQTKERKINPEVPPAAPFVPAIEKISTETPSTLSTKLKPLNHTNPQAIRPANEHPQRQAQSPAEVDRTISSVPPKPRVTETAPLVSASPSPAPIPVKPVLKVHGIAFQDGAESAAVVNGVTVSRGAVIEGARVEEIQKDRVRFSRNGEMFEITLERSN